VVCDVCGANATDAGIEHACKSSGETLAPTGAKSTFGIDQPPSGWRVATWLVFGLAGLHLITVMVRLVLLVQDYQLLQRAKADPHSVTASEALALAGQEHTAASVFQLIFLGYIAAYLLWFFLTRKTAERYGADRRAIVRHWTLTVWRVAILASVLLTFAPSARVSSTDTGGLQIDSLLASDRNGMLYLGGRFLITGLLVAGVWVVRGRVLGLAYGRDKTQPTAARI
jgi:hypothetical protein